MRSLRLTFSHKLGQLYLWPQLTFTLTLNLTYFKICLVVLYISCGLMPFYNMLACMKWLKPKWRNQSRSGRLHGLAPTRQIWTWLDFRFRSSRHLFAHTHKLTNFLPFLKWWSTLSHLPIITCREMRYQWWLRSKVKYKWRVHCGIHK